MSTYDAIVIGGRCAGSPAAMLLARKGYKVLVVDRATFPSDTISTHLIHPPGVAALKRWGLLDRVAATGCPAIHEYSFDLGPLVLVGTPGEGDDAIAYGPRRTVLDLILAEASAEAGAEVRQGFVVDNLIVEDGAVTGIRGHGRGGQPVAERSRVVVGADGLHSLVAKTVGPEQYQDRPMLEAGYYTYWSGLEMNGRFEGYDRQGRAFAAWPTNDGLTVVVVSWPYAEFETNKHDVEGAYHRSLDLAPEFSNRVAGARRVDRFYGTAVPNYFRKPFGPGWALIGDAGYNKDFITAQGITDAFLDAELCVEALDAALAGGASYDAAMGAYHRARDHRALPLFEFTCEFASFAPPPPERQQLMAAIAGNQEAMNGFCRIFSGVVSPADFFSEQNVERIFAAQQKTKAAASPQA